MLKKRLRWAVTEHLWNVSLRQQKKTIHKVEREIERAVNFRFSCVISRCSPTKTFSNNDITLILRKTTTSPRNLDWCQVPLSWHKLKSLFLFAFKRHFHVSSCYVTSQAFATSLEYVKDILMTML